MLFRNEGAAGFAMLASHRVSAAVMGKGMGVAIHDYDGDGFADIFVSNDVMEQFLFHNRGMGRFAKWGSRLVLHSPMMGKRMPGWAPRLPIMTTMAGPTLW